MGSTAASNIVYNAAANVVTATLGGPEALTKIIRERDPAFGDVAVRRYMLRDAGNSRSANVAPAAALGVLYQRLAMRAIIGIDSETVRAFGT
jgi:hypothetical protein